MIAWLIICQGVTFIVASWLAWRYHCDTHRLLDALLSADLRLASALSVARPFMSLISNAEMSDQAHAAFDDAQSRELHRAYHFARTGELMNGEV